MANQNSFSREELNQELANDSELGVEGLDEEDFETIEIEGVPERPGFPTITFIFAIILDLVKIISLGFFGWLASLLGFILVRVYLIGKMSFLKRRMRRKFAAQAFKGSIPILSIFLGSWTFFVLRAHAKNYQKIDKIISTVEKLIEKYN